MSNQTITLSNTEIYTISDILQSEIARLHFKQRELEDIEHIKRIDIQQAHIYDILRILNAKVGN